jgi:peptidoglycan/xylan/chitin deacetylase (PgdA/CDA1 family)
MIDAFYRAAGGVLSPGGRGARLSILIYHRVLPEIDPFFPGEVTGEFFNAQLGALKSLFNVLPLGEAVARLKSDSLPPRAACITFDDGYADNVTVALPILKRHSLSATFFIATAYLNGGRMFNDTAIHAIRNSRDNRIDLSRLGLGEHDLSSPEAKRQAIDVILKQIKYLPLGRREEVAEELASLATSVPPPTDLMMDTQQLQALQQAGMEIGGHTARHPILAKLDATEARREIAEGREYLEALLAQKVKLFAYPNGKPGLDYLPEQVDIIRELGFDAAVSTHWGAARQSSDIFQLPRFTPYTNTISRFTPMLLQNLVRSNHQ